MLNLTLTILIGSKETAPRLFALTTFFMALWLVSTALDYSGIIVQNNELSKQFFNVIPRTDYYLGILVSSSFLYFAYRFTKKDYNKHTRTIKFSLIAFSIISIPLFYSTNIIMGGYEIKGQIPQTTAEANDPDLAPTFDTIQYKETDGPLGIVYRSYYIFCFFLGTFVIWKERRNTLDPAFKKQLTFMFWACAITFSAVALFNVILPRIINIDYGFFGVIASLSWPLLIGYSIIRHNQMNVRVVYSEVLVITAIFLFFIAMFV